MSTNHSEAIQARIRPYQPRDEKQVRFMVGQAQMEPLAFANNRGQCEQTSFAAPTDAKNRPAAYFHPVTLAIWIAVSSIFAQFMK